MPRPDWMIAAAACSTTPDALDIIFENIDRMLTDGCMAEVDGVLGNPESLELPIGSLIGLLSITRAAKEHLPSRQKFWQAVRDKAMADGRDPNRLLARLK